MFLSHIFENSKKKKKKKTYNKADIMLLFKPLTPTD